MRNLLLQWGVELESHSVITEKSTQLINGNLILKRNSNILEVKKNTAIIKALKDIGVPVANILKTHDGRRYVEEDDNIYTLSEKIHGRHIGVDELLRNKAIAHKLGRVLGKLHLGLAEIENSYDFYRNDLVKEFEGWIFDEVKGMDDKYVTKSYYMTLKEQLTLVYPKLKRQPIHRDFHLDNLIFSDDKLAGYIDFDISKDDVRVFDLAYFAVGILAQCLNDEKLALWQPFYQTLIEGYQSVDLLDPVEEKNIWLMMEAIEALFVAYFSKTKNEDLARGADETLKWLVDNAR